MKMKKYTVNYDSKRIKSINAFLSKGKFTIALREIKNYMEDYPNDDLGVLTYADCLLKMVDQKIAVSSNYQEIEDMCLTLINKESKFKGSAYDLLGRLKVKEKDTESAEIYFKNAVALGTDRSKTFLVSVLIENRKSQEALNLIETIKTTDNFPEMTLLKKAIALHNLEREKEAFNTINEIDTSKFNDDQKQRYIRIKAKIYLGMDKVFEAEKMILEGISGMSGYHEEHLILLRCYIKRKAFDKAYRLCKELIENCNEEYKEYAGCYLGKIYELIGYMERARNVYFTMFQNVANLSDKTRNVLYFNLGHLELCDRNYESAKEYFEKVDSVDERDQSKQKFYLSITYMRLKDMENAIEIYDSIKNGKYLERHIPLYQKARNIMLYSRKSPVEVNSYFDRQLVHYQRSLLLQHNTRYHKKMNELSTFKEDINPNHLVDEVEISLQSSPIIESNVTDKYLVYYPNVGYSAGVPTDYMEVITIGGTNKILTMYPVTHFSEEKLQINPSDKPKARQKTSSRIDKFYAKYRLKG